MSEAPRRGFPREEFETRLTRAQRFTVEAELDALFLASEQQVRYFTGFDTQFWASPTRPWFLVLPRDGAPIPVIPELSLIHI